jgi:thiol:disulfide interchange protein DsbC
MNFLAHLPRLATATLVLVATSSLPSIVPMTAAAESLGVAAPSAGDSSDYPELRARLKENVPELQVDTILATPIPHVFAVLSGRSTVLYVDESGQYVLSGHLFKAKDKTDLTAATLAELSRIDPKLLPLADAFTEVHGSGKRQLYVFSDPDCPYCKELETRLPQLADVTIHVFLFPLTSLHPNARHNAISVWCSANRSEAWEAKMLHDVTPTAPECPNPVDRNVELGSRLGFAGTPTLIFADGRVVSGLIPVEGIERLLGPSS